MNIGNNNGHANGNDYGNANGNDYGNANGNGNGNANGNGNGNGNGRKGYGVDDFKDVESQDKVSSRINIEYETVEGSGTRTGSNFRFADVDGIQAK